jgi:hypothetical protein
MVLPVISIFYIFSSWSLLVIQVSAFATVVTVLLIVAWIWYTLATTPPVPLEDFSEGLGEESSETGVGGGEAEETEK